jgi:hypothetical protein
MFSSTQAAQTNPAFSRRSALLVFAVACGFVEELWFRGLLLSLLPLVSTTPSIIIQAFAFAAYEALSSCTCSLRTRCTLRSSLSSPQRWERCGLG